MSRRSKHKDSWSTTSSSRSSSSSSSKSSWSSKTKSSYSRFSSRSEDELKSKKKYESDDQRSRSRSINKSSTSLRSSNDSLASSQSNKSVFSDSNDYSLPKENLPLNVLQLLMSVRESEINCRNRLLKYESNIKKLKISESQSNSEAKEENKQIAESLLNESIELIGLNAVVYGENHLKLAWAHINLAQVYLECKNLPRQAKQHCEDAFRIQVDYLKKLSVDDNFEPEDEHEYELMDQKYQMILNYVYGRACILLKENKEGEKSLEQAEDYYQNWKLDSKKTGAFKKLKPLFYKWQKKIYMALAKQYNKNEHYSNALIYYDKLTNILDRKRLNTKTTDSEALNEHNSADILLIEILEEKASLEKNRDNLREAVALQKDAIRIAETFGSKSILLNCKFNLAKLYADQDDLTSSENSEDLFKECIEIHEKNFDEVTEKILKIKEEFVKFYLRQDKYDDCCKLLNSLIKEQILFSGQYSVKLTTNYKLLCSVYLKRNDMPSAAKFLQKALEFEEMNYGAKDKRTLATKETLDELKKNPNVAEKLKALTKKSSEAKPSFHAGKKINYYKDDLKVYAQVNNTEDANATVLNKSGLNTSLNTTRTSRMDDDFLQNLNPLK